MKPKEELKAIAEQHHLSPRCRTALEKLVLPLVQTNKTMWEKSEEQAKRCQELEEALAPLKKEKDEAKTERDSLAAQVAARNAKIVLLEAKIKELDTKAPYKYLTPAETGNGAAGIMRLNNTGLNCGAIAPQQLQQRIDSLKATVKHYLPSFAELTAVLARQPGLPVATMHQDGFAGGYDRDEYLLLGMAAKYAGMLNVAFLLSGANGETFGPDSLAEQHRLAKEFLEGLTRSGGYDVSDKVDESGDDQFHNDNR